MNAPIDEKRVLPEESSASGTAKAAAAAEIAPIPKRTVPRSSFTKNVQAATLRTIKAATCGRTGSMIITARAAEICSRLNAIDEHRNRPTARMAGAYLPMHEVLK